MLVLARKHTSKTAITTSNKVRVTSPLSPRRPDVPICHHSPKGKQTGPCTRGALSPSGGSPPPAPTGSPRCPHPGRPSRRLCVPGGGALRAGGLRARRAGLRRARSLRAGRPAAVRPPPRPPRGSDRRPPPARVGLRRQRPGLGALPRSQRVRFGFTTKSPRHRNPAEGRRRPRPGRGGRRWRARAPGEGGGDPARRRGARGSQLGGGAGQRNRFFQTQAADG